MSLRSQLVSDLHQVPLPSMLRELGRGVADAQFGLDQAGMEIAQRLGDAKTYGVQFSGEENKRSLLELGFAPTFYHFAEATIDVRVSLSMSQAFESTVSASATVGGAYYVVMFAASVSASFTAKYSYEASGSSALTARLVAIPPPTVLAEALATRRIAPATADDA